MDAPATGLTLPLVSVVIPTFNRSNALRYAIRSAISQRFQDFEVLVIGDACTDDSEQVVVEAGDPRLRWHNLEQRHGHSYGPVNVAFGLARGRYIANLGHDDLWLPNHLELVVGALEESGADLAYSAIEMVWRPDRSDVFATDINAEGKREDYFRGNFIHPSCLAFRRELVDELGPWLNPQSTGIHADWEFVQRACRAGKRFAFVPVLTAVKFPASTRPGVYEERPYHEQAARWRLVERYGDGYASLAYQGPLLNLQAHASALGEDMARQLAEHKAVLADREQQLAEHKAVLADRERQLAEHKAVLANREQQLAEHKAVLADRERRLAEHESDLANSVRRFAEHGAVLAERERGIAAEHRAVRADRERQLAEHKAVLADRERQLAEHKAVLADREHQLAEHKAVLARLAQ